MQGHKGKPLLPCQPLAQAPVRTVQLLDLRQPLCGWACSSGARTDAAVAASFIAASPHGCVVRSLQPGVVRLPLPPQKQQQQPFGVCKRVCVKEEVLVECADSFNNRHSIGTLLLRSQTLSACCCMNDLARRLSMRAIFNSTPRDG
jgi:hypothetical protein